jgi:hypothetical protein
MARDPRKHQQRQERRHRREKEKRKEHARVISMSFSPMAMLEVADDAPFIFCGIHDCAFTEGMGNLIVARKLPNGQCVFVAFLVDLYCLGIKDVTIDTIASSRFDREIVRQIYREEPPVRLTPADAKKLVLGAARFAAKYGFMPQAEFELALGIFRGVDETTAVRDFEFGKDGKPLYINGPHDGRAFQDRVRHTLERTAGPGGYDVFVMTGDIDEFDSIDDDIDRPRARWGGA